MVRYYKAKTDRKVSSPRKVSAGIKLMKEGWSIRQAADKVKVNRQTLFKYFKRMTDQDSESAELKISFQSRNVFSPSIENDIANYCLEVSNMGYGLSVRMARDLAYEVAQKNNLKFPPSWDENKTAGIDWFQGFEKRQPNIALRVPEACSIARAMAFNGTNVNLIFDKLAAVQERHPSFKDGNIVLNLDETNTSTK